MKLSDFGIARAEQDASLTATGLVTGSPAYISPEVASGRPASGASDVWSLGATAYHALSGHPPYDVGDNVLGALYRIVHEDPPPLLDGGWTTEFVTAAMTRDPDQRWSMAEVAAFLHAGETPTRRSRRASSAPVPPEADPTQRLSVVAADEAATATPAEALPAADPPPVAASPTHTARSPRRRGALPLLLGAAVVVVVVLLGLLLLRDDGTQQADPGSQPPSSETSPTQPTDEPSESAGPDADAMEGFVSDYLALADSDPASAFQRLTPAYQGESGGLSATRASGVGSARFAAHREGGPRRAHGDLHLCLRPGRQSPDRPGADDPRAGR